VINKEKIKLLCRNGLIDAVIDKFGRDVSIRKYDEEHFILETEKIERRLNCYKEVKDDYC